MSKEEKAKEFLRTHYITYKREQYECLTKADSIDFAVNFAEQENKELIEKLINKYKKEWKSMGQSKSYSSLISELEEIQKAIR